MITSIDYIIAPVSWLIGNIVFNNFEKHLPLYRRAFKLAATILALYAVGYFLGRMAFYIMIGAMAMGMVLLHVWWFPKNGVNGLTAEPYSRYLKLINGVKRVRIRY